MAGAFQVLHANGLVSSRMIKAHLLGEHDQPNNLMAGNADATSFPRLGSKSDPAIADAPGPGAYVLEK